MYSAQPEVTAGIDQYKKPEHASNIIQKIFTFLTMFFNQT
jgi:hypothetical protein